MRLWHKYLIPYLPRQQLLGQWRECCCIAKSIHDRGTPKHMLVNKIMDYPLSDFTTYGSLVASEMYKRGYNVDEYKFDQYFMSEDYDFNNDTVIFKDWHTNRYLVQCFHNLEEKYDCGCISLSDFKKIQMGVFNVLTGKDWNEYSAGI